MAWEGGVAKHLAEATKTFKTSRDGKQETIEKVLLDDLMIPLEELEKRVIENGFSGY